MAKYVDYVGGFIKPVLNMMKMFVHIYTTGMLETFLKI